MHDAANFLLWLAVPDVVLVPTEAVVTPTDFLVAIAGVDVVLAML